MENNIHKKIRSPPIEELTKRIQDLEDAHAHLKQKMFKFMISGDRKTSNSISSRKWTQHSPLVLTETDYFNILQSIDQPIHITNLKRCIIYRNQAWENLYGYSAEEIRGKGFLDLVVEPKDLHIANDILQQMLKGECWTGEFPIRNKRGERFVIIGSTKPLRDENGTIIGIISVSAAPRPYQQIKLNAPIVNETNTLFSKSIWKGNEQRGCFDPSTSRCCWHWIHSDQDKYGLRMRANVENQQWKVNTNCVSRDNKALSTWSLFNHSFDCEIKWEDLRIREVIGRGSCGIRYHAVWQGSDVALKLFSKEAHSHDFVVSFMHEASLMKRLRHPNILLFMGTVASPQHICIVTEFLRRGNLFKLLHRKRARLDWRRRIRMAIDIARGINYLHHCLPPIIHRDLNSSKLLVDKDWTVKPQPQWMAPEVLRNEEADERSDIYTYGVVLCEITTEKIPWDDLNSIQVMEAVGVMNRGLDIPKDVDPQWASLIQRCLWSEPQLRPTFKEILEELHQLDIRFKFMPPLNEDSKSSKELKIMSKAFDMKNFHMLTFLILLVTCIVKGSTIGIKEAKYGSGCYSGDYNDKFQICCKQNFVVKSCYTKMEDCKKNCPYTNTA
ncbi:unnamed protein product [Lactuca saligna]|uniref:Uncharacterized protein n=1 Tax=Lactuca saligna TaxID=75948 RepID=A0AA35UZ05_LACSI|nr:unnamed protein product [Lactuca saligna]